MVLALAAVVREDVPVLTLGVALDVAVVALLSVAAMFFGETILEFLFLLRDPNRCKMGSRKMRVLPDPVWAITVTSLPAHATGMALAWTHVGANTAMDTNADAMAGPTNAAKLGSVGSAPSSCPSPLV